MCEQSLTLCPFVLCVRGVQNQATVDGMHSVMDCFLLLWRTIARFGAALRGEGRVGAALAATPTPANDGACFIAFVPSAPASVVWLSLPRSSTAVAGSAAQWACAIASDHVALACHVRVAGFTTVYSSQTGSSSSSTMNISSSTDIYRYI